MGLCSVDARGLPGLGVNADRTVIDVNAAPWRILGRVQTGLGERCTGFAIAPNVVETAAHCLWIVRTGHYVVPWDVHFLLGYRMGAFRVHARATRIIVAGGYDPRREAETASEDRALLVLDRSVVRPSYLLPVIRAWTGSIAMLGGYQQDRGEVAIGDMHCRIVSDADAGSGGMIRHDCAGTHGVSGAPLLIPDGRGGWGIAGVAVLASGGQGGLAAKLPR